MLATTPPTVAGQKVLQPSTPIGVGGSEEMRTANACLLGAARAYPFSHYARIATTQLVRHNFGSQTAAVVFSAPTQF